MDKKFLVKKIISPSRFPIKKIYKGNLLFFVSANDIFLEFSGFRTIPQYTIQDCFVGIVYLHYLTSNHI